MVFFEDVGSMDFFVLVIRGSGNVRWRLPLVAYFLGFVGIPMR